jgi:hypothetical protein
LVGRCFARALTGAERPRLGASGQTWAERELAYQTAIEDNASVVDVGALQLLASIGGKSATARTARKLRAL